MRVLVVASVLAIAALAGCSTPGDPTAEAPSSVPDAGPPAQGPGGAPGDVMSAPVGNGSPPANASLPPGPPPTWGSPDTAELFPGINDQSGCTTNFLFTSLDSRRIFLGSAAHCFSQDSGDPTNDWGPCEADAQYVPLGSPIRFLVPGQTSVDWTVQGKPVAYLDLNGTLAYSSWHAMQDAGEDIGDPVCWTNDFVLIEVPLEAQGRITPHFRGLGAPTGLATADDVAAGRDLVSYGNSDLWMGVEALHVKQGKVTQAPDPDTRPISFVAAFAPPGISGDSGSAALTPDGKAAGVLSGYGWVHEGDVGTGEYAFLPAVLEYMRVHTGLEVKLAQP